MDQNKGFLPVLYSKVFESELDSRNLKRLVFLHSLD